MSKKKSVRSLKLYSVLVHEQIKAKYEIPAHNKKEAEGFINNMMFSESQRREKEYLGIDVVEIKRIKRGGE